MNGDTALLPVKTPHRVRCLQREYNMMLIKEHYNSGNGTHEVKQKKRWNSEDMLNHELRRKDKPLMPSHQLFAEDLRVSWTVLKALTPAQKHQVCK